MLEPTLAQMLQHTITNYNAKCGCGAAAAKQRGGAMQCSRVTRSGAERSNAAVPQGLCGQREVFKAL